MPHVYVVWTIHDLLSVAFWLFIVAIACIVALVLLYEDFRRRVRSWWGAK